MPSIVQGNVILLPVQQLDGQKLSFLTLAEGEFPPERLHSTEQGAELLEKNSTRYLRVIYETLELTSK